MFKVVIKKLMRATFSYRIDCNGAFPVIIIRLLGETIVLAWAGKLIPLPQAYLDRYAELNRTIGPH